MRVLAPLDGSEQSDRALERGLRLLARVGKVQVTVLNVIHESFRELPEHLREAMELKPEMEVHTEFSEAKRTADRGVAIAKGLGLEATPRIAQGKPVDEILKLSAEHDLLLVHSLGTSQTKEVLRGSKTERIVRHAKCDVLVVHEEL